VSQKNRKDGRTLLDFLLHSNLSQIEGEVDTPQESLLRWFPNIFASNTTDMYTACPRARACIT
jgi:hypothetical protein